MDKEELGILQEQISELRGDLKEELKGIKSDLKRLLDPEDGVYPLITGCETRLDALEPKVKSLTNSERKRAARVSTYVTVGIITLKHLGGKLWDYIF